MRARYFRELFSQLFLYRLKFKGTASVLFFCFIFGFSYAQPHITSLTPLSGSPGTLVTISGANFAPVPSQNIVHFGATTALVTSATSSTLTVVVPFGSTYEPVTVTTGGLIAYAPSAFVVTFEGNCSGTAAVFGSSATIATGAYPRHVVANDIDGDGKPDLIVTNHMASGFSVFRNISTGAGIALASRVDFTSSTEPFATAAGDLDGDGKAEVVICNYPSNTLSVFKNTSTPGNVSFAPKMEVTTGLNPMFMAIADLDKDGKPDIVAVNNNGNSISVFRNTTNGAISFASKVDFAVGAWPINLFLSDFDGDGYTDVAVPNFDDNTVSVLRNTSTAAISFAPKKNYATGDKPFWVTSGDLDGDGKPEMVVANSGSGTINIFHNTASPGNISFINAIAATVGNSPVSVFIADLDGNAKPDLVTADFASNQVSVISNQSSAGNLSFNGAVNFPTGSLPRCVAIADLDGDNKPELSVVNSTNNTMTILRNKTSVLSLTATYSIPTCSRNDGSINAIATGGLPPYQYNIGTLPFQSTGRFTQLSPGTYTVRVKDASGCMNSSEVILPSNYLWFTIAVADAGCNSNNGSLTVSAGGTNPPFSYSLNGTNFQSNPVFNNLAAGIYNVYVKDKEGCMKQTGFAVQSACLTITPTITNTTCGFGNGEIQVQASGGTAPYLYSLDGAQYTSNNTFINLPAKDYTVYVRDASGITATQAVTLANTPGPVLSSADVTPADCFNPTGSITISAQGGTPPFQYVLNAVTFQTTPVFSSLAAGSYKVTVRDGNGCFDSRTAVIPLNNNSMVNAGNDLTICEGSNVTIAASSNGSNFSWLPATGLNNTSVVTPVASPKTTTTYVLTATSGACTSTDTMTVNVLPAPVANAGKDTSICPGQSLALNGSGGVTYSWSPSTYLSDASSASPVMSGTPKGNYIYLLGVKDRNGCPSLTPATVKVAVVVPVVDAGRDTVVLSNRPFQLQAQDPGNYGFVQYAWSPSIGLNNPGIANPVATTDRDVVYTVTAQTQNGCTATDNISIKVYNGIEIYVPNAFTPNSDGRNDILKAIPVGIKEFRFLSLYNRWGQLIFQTKNAAKGWDGKLNGVLQTGVFVWMAEGVDYNGNLVRRKGTTTVIR